MCVFKNISLNRKKNFKKIFIESLDKTIDTRVTNLFLEYFKKIRNIKQIYDGILKIKEKCKFKEQFACKNFGSNFLFKRERDDILDPIQFFTKIQNFLVDFKNLDTIDPICNNCINDIRNKAKEILESLKSSQIIVEYENFQSQSAHFNKSSYFYEYLITKSHNYRDYKEVEKNYKQENKERLIDTYCSGKDALYQVNIYEIANKTEKKYKVSLPYELLSDGSYFEKIIHNIFEKIQILRFDDVVSLEDLIKLYKKEALRLIEIHFKISEDKKRKVAFYSAIKTLQLEKLFPLLIDDFIEEIFLDSPASEIYIDHQVHGRCRTDIRLSLNEIKRIITLLRLYSKQRLDYSSPSLKYVIKNKYFFCRFAIDIEPINVHKFSLDIRKLNKNILTIQDLVKNETLSPLIAAFLYFCVLRKINITVTGETDTGKTTLINAFDLLAPQFFRKIYVENVTESLEQLNYENHQLKYQANSLDPSTNDKFTKSNHIKTLLHRTPDIIYLGEILTQEEAEALFHCLAAGLRGFQTIHSNTVDSLINRFIYVFKINFSQLDDLDLVVLMKREFNKRRIVSISEIDLLNYQAGEYYRELFQYNPETKNFDLQRNLYKTKTINKLKKFEYLSEKSFSDFLSLYEEIFEFLSKINKISNTELIDLFHEISHLSIISYLDLKQFWEEWKINHESKIETIEKLIQN